MPFTIDPNASSHSYDASDHHEIAFEPGSGFLGYASSRSVPTAISGIFVEGLCTASPSEPDPSTGFFLRARVTSDKQKTRPGDEVLLLFHRLSDLERLLGAIIAGCIGAAARDISDLDCSAYANRCDIAHEDLIGETDLSDEAYDEVTLSLQTLHQSADGPRLLLTATPKGDKFPIMSLSFVAHKLTAATASVAFQDVSRFHEKACDALGKRRATSIEGRIKSALTAMPDDHRTKFASTHLDNWGTKRLFDIVDRLQSPVRISVTTDALTKSGLPLPPDLGDQAKQCDANLVTLIGALGPIQAEITLTNVAKAAKQAL